MHFKEKTSFLKGILRRFFLLPAETERTSIEDRYRSLGARVGRHTRIFGQLDGVNPQLVTLGNYCVVGVQSAVLTHCPIKGGMPVVIGNYVWMGFDVKILPDVTVGSYCVIGAGSVVTKNIPDNSVVAGVPAKVIRELTDEEIICLISDLESDEPIGKV